MDDNLTSSITASVAITASVVYHGCFRPTQVAVASAFLTSRERSPPAIDSRVHQWRLCAAAGAFWRVSAIGRKPPFSQSSPACSLSSRASSAGLPSARPCAAQADAQLHALYAATCGRLASSRFSRRCAGARRTPARAPFRLTTFALALDLLGTRPQVRPVGEERL